MPKNKSINPRFLFYRLAIVAIGCLAVIISTELLLAQPGLPGSAPEQTPIDGGLGILAALGGAYAIKKLREKE